MSNRGLSGVFVCFSLLVTNETAMGVTAPLEIKVPASSNLAPMDIVLSYTADATDIEFSENDFLVAHGFAKNEANEKSIIQAQKDLKISILGNKRDFEAIKSVCSQNTEPFLLNTKDINLQCAYVELKKQQKTNVNTHEKKSKKSSKKLQLATIEAWKKTTSWTYREAIGKLNFKDLDSGVRLARFAQESGCSTAITGAALIGKLEEFLPDADAWGAIESTYGRISSCLEPISVVSEQLHLRMGLLYILQNRKPEATEALNRALLSIHSPEEFRTLFWRGYLEATNLKTEGGLKMRWNPYWQRLVASYPLTQHALLVLGLFAEHPLKDTQNKAALAINPYAGKAWNVQNLSNLIFLNLFTKRDLKTAKEFGRKMLGAVPVENAQPVLFTSLAFKKLGYNQESMRLIYNYIRVAGQAGLTPQTIRMLYPVHFLDLVEKHAKSVEVPLVMSLMRQESSFVPYTKSKRGALGLMQIIPETAKRYKKSKSLKTQLLEPDVNIFAGCRFLESQLQGFDGNEVLTLAAYNAGPKNAEKWHARFENAAPLLYADLIPFSETRAYVSGVLRGRFWYRYIINGLLDANKHAVIELTYAEHLLGRKLEADVASRKEPMGEVSLLAKSLLPDNAYVEESYQESF